MNLTSQIKIEDFDGETALVTIREESKRLPAKKRDQGIRKNVLIVRGLVGAYATGTKAWPASATVVTNPNTGEKWVDVEFGFDSRCGKHSKRATVSFAK